MPLYIYMGLTCFRHCGASKKSPILKKNILTPVAVFEDNEHLKNTLELLLNTTEGFCCSGAYSSCDGIIENLEAFPATIVLMDIEMPGMNGIDATKLVKKHFP